MLEKVKPRFEKGGKLEKYYPVYNAFETFLFVPGETTPPQGAHIRDAIDLKRTMILVVMSMMPCLFFGMWNTGYQHYLALGMTGVSFWDTILFGLAKVLPLVVVTYVTGLAVEFTFAVIRKHKVNGITDVGTLRRRGFAGYKEEGFESVVHRVILLQLSAFFKPRLHLLQHVSDWPHAFIDLV